MGNLKNRSYAILGTGAIGGFYGGKLQKAGFEVHFLLHRDYEYVKENGLIVESADGDFALEKVNAYNRCASRCPGAMWWWWR
jgi:2-dehydropantoate 2-reductase